MEKSKKLEMLETVGWRNRKIKRQRDGEIERLRIRDMEK
jgi:hypothetical protein